MGCWSRYIIETRRPTAGLYIPRRGPEDTKATGNVLVRGAPATFKSSGPASSAGQGDHRTGFMMGSEVIAASQWSSAIKSQKATIIITTSKDRGATKDT